MFGKILVLIATFVMVACAHVKEAKDTPVDPVTEDMASCDLSFPKSTLCASFNWEKKPTETDAGSFVLEFHGDLDPSQFVDLIVPLHVVLWMPSMGHGSSPVTIDHLGMGQYRVSKVFFSMRGEWEIRIQLKRGDAVVEQAVTSVRH
ncbi:FixH family protein [Bdellovibrio sp. HCB337]|uniref:FixH family protein n=1 Tax=Bdellovibrio sp. HCB337 TaxID=3394358 RepID=UPI0039A61DFB